MLLRQLRKRARLTQEQLAERSTVSVRTIRRLETGRSTDHRLRTLHLLADALEVGTEERRQLTDTLDRAQQVAVVEPPGPAPITPTEPPAGGLADAAASLAREVRRRWQREEGHRRVHDPFPLPVRWQPVPAELMDRPENIQRLQPGATPQGLDLSGDLRSVVETYRSIASGRLVILGRAGSGKSVLAIKFALGLLAAPAAPARVPVIFSIGSWDPTTTTLRDLLVDRLLRDHPHLARRVPSGSTLAAALVDADLILPVLDGFDEIAEALRAVALETLNAFSLPLVLTSRRDEYARAVRAVHAPLVWAAGIELTDLTVEDLAAYLPRTDRLAAHGGAGGGAGLWDAVLEQLRVCDASASTQLAEVLRTPLMVILARTMYSEAPGKDPAELLDTARFPTASRLEEHLLAGFVPTVYRRRAPERLDAGRGQRNRDPDQTQRWLGYLAHTLTQGTHHQQDLAWWRLGQNLRVSTRVLHTALVSALCMAMATWLVQLLTTASGYGEPAGLGPSLLYGVLVGVFSGAAFGLTYFVLAVFGRTTAVPSRVRLRLSAADRRAGRNEPLRAFFTRFRFMLLGGSALGIGYSWAVTLMSVLYSQLPLSHTELMKIVLINTLLYGLIIGLTAGLIFGILAAFEAPMDITAAATPIRLLSVNRTTVRRQLLVLVPALGLGYVLCGYAVVHLFQGLLGTLLWPMQGAVLVGAVGGLGGATSYVLAFTAWGQWLTLSRIWLPMTRRLPWDTAAFLEDAYQRGVLRQAGAVYQFRHIRLQRHLAQSYRHRHTDRTSDDTGQTR
ncbi:helix-turn-helix transcriptional regulator [Streptomyces fungicidicus]|uniref:helix-turn-helix transcriptional regulator n=1 Tax=Streptomyces fungicidicus TaxID=68203 RepID=UPI00292A5750|nr:helix-turn-helix transcriptional regulator [Streptomyces fungicidicus]